jgi:pimeloyl-ACP methyl ester carboxylesterase
VLLIIAAGLAGPVLASATRMAVATAFVVEFLSQGRYPLLSRLTDTPARRRVIVRGMEFETLGESRARASLVLVHGFTPDGNRDRRLGRAAALLARAGFAVVVPTLPGLTRGRLRPADAEPVVAALTLRPPPVTLVAVSVGAGPALLAASDPRVRDRVETVLVLGGYASAHELVRYFLTGAYAFGSVRGQTTHDPEVVRAFIAANADLVAPPLREALESGETGAAEKALTALAPLLDTLSPERLASRIPGRLILIHGLGDRAVPYTETLRLAAARPDDTAVVLVGVIGHVEGGGHGRLGAARDLLCLWGVTYALIAGR